MNNYLFGIKKSFREESVGVSELSEEDAYEQEVVEYLAWDVERALDIFGKSVNDLSSKSDSSKRASKVDKGEGLLNKRKEFAKSVRAAQSKWKDIKNLEKEIGKKRIEELKKQIHDDQNTLSEETQSMINNREELIISLKQDIKFLFESDKNDNGGRANKMINEKRVKDLESIIRSSKMNPGIIDQYLAVLMHGKQRGWNFLRLGKKRSRIGFGVKKLHSSIVRSHWRSQQSVCGR